MLRGIVNKTIRITVVSASQRAPEIKDKQLITDYIPAVERLVADANTSIDRHAIDGILAFVIPFVKRYTIGNQPSLLLIIQRVRVERC